MEKNRLPIIKFSHFKFKYPSSNSFIEFEGDFSISKNECILITGPSGSGKSTFLNILKGIIPFYITGTLEGQIFIKGKNIIDKYPDDLKSKILMLFQNPYTQIVTPYVKDEIVFPMENFYRNNKNQFELISKKYQKIVELFNFYKILNNETFSLSGGEIQKIMLGSLLAVEPEVILLDEPTAFLDPESRNNFFNIIHKIKGKYTIIIIEHNFEKIIDIVDKILVFNKNGKINLLNKENFLDKIEKKEIININLNTYEINRIFNFLKIINIKKKKQINNINKNLIEIQNLFFKYKNNPESIFEDVNLKIDNETISILGKNGIGKTTFLKLLSGILKPQKGNISIEKNNIAFLFQNPETHFMFNTVKLEIMHNIKTWVKEKDKQNQIFEEIINFFNFKNYINKNPFQLSEGEKRRLTYALTIALNKDIILLDEPTFGQDIENRNKIIKFTNILKKLGKTIIIVTHDIEFAKIVSDKIYQIKNKKIELLSYID